MSMGSALLRRLRRCGYALVVALVSGCGGAAFDAEPSSILPVRGDATIMVDWTREVGSPDPTDYRPREIGGVAVAEAIGVVVASGRTGVVEGFRTSDGERIWSLGVEYELASAPAAGDDHRVYLGLSDARLLCLDGRDGTILWTYQASSPLHGLVTVGASNVYVIGADNGLLAIDRATGTLAWRHQQTRPVDIVMLGAPEVTETDEGVFAGFSDGRLVHFALDGTLRWVLSLNGTQRQLVDVDTRPLVVGDQVLAASFTGGLGGVDIESGELVWQVDVRGASSLVGLDGGNAVTATADGHVVWVDPTRGAVVGDLNLEARALTEAVRYGGMLLVGSRSHGIFVLAPDSPWIYTRFDTGVGFSARPAVSGDRFYALDDRGTLYAARIEPVPFF
jgi:outer membrane protein assembly factor BamB